ncbi:hypothetical protein SAMN05216499_12416 [Actinacidiphila paucisporea]|uniref:Uncharacterized protein n=1 Tax=Actinacidiphila paucisporea TaxID=310782 RepID=A0A1M7PKM1_9ACTN|nr:hypothetical protein SAMN05216499_12416 [Actinacidiphila paucisporea]
MSSESMPADRMGGAGAWAEEGRGSAGAVLRAPAGGGRPAGRAAGGHRPLAAVAMARMAVLLLRLRAGRRA